VGVEEKKQKHEGAVISEKSIIRSSGFFNTIVVKKKGRLDHLCYRQIKQNQP
jgi:hypothetical protein